MSIKGPLAGREDSGACHWKDPWAAKALREGTPYPGFPPPPRWEMETLTRFLPPSLGA